MDNNWLDSQFDRAVEIIQGLSKTGPIQTGYEEKLAMYSLYKQATVGDVPSTRPGMWDVLGRAKWDAWAKHRNMDSHAAKQLYVDTLLRVLRKYSGRTVARDLARELDAYRPENEEYEPRSSSSASTSEALSPPPEPQEEQEEEQEPDLAQEQGYPQTQEAYYSPEDLLHSTSTEQWGQVSRSAITAAIEEDAFRSSATAAAAGGARSVVESDMTGLGARPVSSVSKYRTPMTQSIHLPLSERASPPPLQQQQPAFGSLPAQQPLPRTATPSAYAPQGQGPPTTSSLTSTGYGPSASAPAPDFPLTRIPTPTYAPNSTRPPPPAFPFPPHSLALLSLVHSPPLPLD